MPKNKVSFFQKGSIEIVNGDGNHRFPYHTHESYLVGVIKSGEVRLIIGSREYVLTPGMTYLVPSKVGMSITPIKPYSYLTICIKNSRMDRYELNTPNQMVIHGLGEKILALSDQFTLDKLTEEVFIRQLCKIIGMHSEQKKSVDSPNDIILLAEKYIKEHINDKFLLNNIAQTVYISKYHLIRLFKKEMGITPKQYDQQSKIRRAKTSILKEESEVDIAIDLNFSNQSHMCSTFRRYMGISPKEYRHSVKISKQ